MSFIFILFHVFSSLGEFIDFFPFAAMLLLPVTSSPFLVFSDVTDFLTPETKPTTITHLQNYDMIIFFFFNNNLSL